MSFFLLLVYTTLFSAQNDITQPLCSFYGVFQTNWIFGELPQNSKIFAVNQGHKVLDDRGAPILCNEGASVLCNDRHFPWSNVAPSRLCTIFYTHVDKDKHGLIFQHHMAYINCILQKTLDNEGSEIIITCTNNHGCCLEMFRQNLQSCLLIAETFTPPTLAGLSLDGYRECATLSLFEHTEDKDLYFLEILQEQLDILHIGIYHGDYDKAGCTQIRYGAAALQRAMICDVWDPKKILSSTPQLEEGATTTPQLEEGAKA